MDSCFVCRAAAFFVLIDETAAIPYNKGVFTPHKERRSLLWIKKNCAGR